MLDDLGLIPALRWQAREMSKRTAIDVSVATELTSDDLPDQFKTCLYRVVQEALHNCEKHSAATKVRVLVTSGDVMHSWFVPPAGVQMYAVPGRLNETWIEIDQEGTFYGSCNQICGINHGFMPIEIEAVSNDKFQQWVAAAQKKFARVDGEPAVRVAAGASAQ